MRTTVKVAARIPVAGLLAALSMTVAAIGQSRQAGAERSLMARSFDAAAERAGDGEPHALLDRSLFAIAPPDVRTFQVHDLVQIIVRETSRAESKHELDTDKEYGLDGSIDAFPNLQLEDILNFQLEAGRTEDLPAVALDFKKEFEGEGDYKRQDDLTARLSAEVIEILPNGNLVLEAQTIVRNDEETSTIRVTGTCRAEDVTPANTILSSQIHDLRVEKINQGELKKTNEKGILAKIFDAIFAF